jgi:membrane protein DedA with SNARE-associated domain
VEKYGKYIFLSPDKLEKGKNAFNKYGATVILIGRWIPGLRIALTAAAGIFELKYIKFITAMFFSTIIWSSAFLIAGILARSQHMRIFSFLEYVNGLIGYAIYFGAFFLVAVGVYLYLKWYKRG